MFNAIARHMTHTSGDPSRAGWHELRWRDLAAFVLASAAAMAFWYGPALSQRCPPVARTLMPIWKAP